MQDPKILENLFWLIVNDKKAEFALWCKRHDAEPDDPWSVQLFKNEQIKEAV